MPTMVRPTLLLIFPTGTFALQSSCNITPPTHHHHYDSLPGARGLLSRRSEQTVLISLSPRRVAMLLSLWETCTCGCVTQRLFKKRETEDTSYRGKKSQVKIQASFLKEIRTSNPIQTSYCQVRVSINAPSSGGKVFFKSHDEQLFIVTFFCFVSFLSVYVFCQFMCLNNRAA